MGSVRLSGFIIAILALSISCNAQGKNGLTKCVHEVDSILNKELFTSADVFPKYGEGEDDFLTLFSKNFKYVPVDEHIQSKVVLEFIVDSIGNVRYPTIANKRKDQYTAIEKEALKILIETRQWHPAKCNGRHVWFKMRLPVFICFRD